MEPWSGGRLVAEVERLGARGLPYGRLHEELATSIRRVVPLDAFCWHGLDPETRLLTTANPVELMQAGFLTPDTEAMAAGAVVRSEYLRDGRAPGLLMLDAYDGVELATRPAELLLSLLVLEYALPLRLGAFGLTAREREVATWVARGLDTAAIAERLVISAWTVQDHLKAVFAKTDTPSRRELLSQVFFHDQLPGIVAHDPLNAGGHLQEPDAGP